MKGARIDYCGGIAAIIVSTLFMMGRPIIIMYVLDSVLGDTITNLPSWAVRVLSASEGSSVLNMLLWNALLFLLLTVVGGYFMYLKGLLTARASERMAKNIRDQLYTQLQHKSYAYHVQIESGDVMQRCTSDVETIRLFYANQLTEIGRAASILVIITVILVNLNMRLALISIAMMPLIFIFSFFYFKRVRSKFKAVDEAEGALSNVIQENLTGIRVVRAFARQEYEIEKFDIKNSIFRDRVYELLRLLATYWSVSDWTCLMQLSMVMLLGGYWTAAGILTLGTYMAGIAYVERLLWPIRLLGRILTDMGKMIVAKKRIGAILDGKNEYDVNGSSTPPITGKIEFRDVSFAYDKEPVLKHVSFSVEPGETVAILGPTGSGKSTLMHLLARLYECDSGQILIDGVPITEIEKKYLREHVGIVLQEPFLFKKSVRENIALGVKRVEEKEITQTAAAAAVHSVIMKFDKQYDTEVGEGGVTLSGGQKQRIAIARILIKNPPIIIFDDSLSAVDTITDEAIRRSLRRREHTATTFIISHRITSLSEADKIIVLERGRVQAVGTHEQLIVQEGLYKRIWELQTLSEMELKGAEQEEIAANE